LIRGDRTVTKRYRVDLPRTTKAVLPKRVTAHLTGSCRAGAAVGDAALEPGLLRHAPGGGYRERAELARMATAEQMVTELPAGGSRTPGVISA